MVGVSLGIKRHQFIDFVGAFVKNDDYPQLTSDDRVIHLLFNNFGNFEVLPCRQVLDKSCVSYTPDNSSTMYLFNVPNEYKREYNKFIQSKYSEFSENYKQSIIKFHDYREGCNPRGIRDGSKIVDILYKREAAYVRQEEAINKDLPVNNWTRIPRGQEIGKKWDENEELTLFETYSTDLKSKELKIDKEN